MIMSDKDLEAPAETEEKKPAEPPHKLPRIRVCGKWQKPGYKPSKAELDQWTEDCKQRGHDPKTGAPAKAKPAAKSK